MNQPPPDNKIFVPNVPVNFNEYDLMKYFEKTGPVARCTIRTKVLDGGICQFGYLRFENADSAKRWVKGRKNL